MITIEGTVKEIRGYPLISDANKPATSAAINAAAPAGMLVKSTNSNLSVLAIAPIIPAQVAISIVLLNIIENPNTPTKLAGIRKSIIGITPRSNGMKFTGFK